jgi:DNA repair exonuclease SbcCD ATPase subunit
MILENIMGQINENLALYSKFLGFELEFTIDSQSSRKDIHQFIYKNEVIKPYTDLSGGQQQLVDIGTAFAIVDAVNSLNSCNIILLDEVFESLSANNIELVGDILTYKAKERNVILITHHTSFSPQNSQVIELEIASNGNTQMIG